jgi:hypothetical protein
MLSPALPKMMLSSALPPSAIGAVPALKSVEPISTETPSASVKSLPARTRSWPSPAYSTIVSEP